MAFAFYSSFCKCAEGGGSVHSKTRLVSSRQHRATEVRKLRFLSSCQYTHGCYAPFLGPHDTLPCVLIWLVLGSYCHCQQVVTFFFFGLHLTTWVKGPTLTLCPGPLNFSGRPCMVINYNCAIL